jgi:hypothetical protein
MSRAIYLRDADGNLIKMQEEVYEEEDLFQRMLVEAAELLPGEQINPDAPRRWLLIAREVGVPGVGSGAGRGLSLDHLFLDQDGVPTFVEVKRSTDTRLRREVVGQMLDYAANATAYWPVGFIREQFYAWCDAYDLDPAEQLDAVLEGEMTEERYWEVVHTNLLAGKVRLLFVADIIPQELQRIIEFLNERMDPTEVLGAEIRRYVGGGMETFIPSVVGWTAEAKAAKGAASRGGREWDEESFLEVLTQENGLQEVQLAQAILAWARGREIELWWGSGQRGSMIPGLYHGDRWHSTLYVWTNGYLEFPFQRMAGQPPFDDDALRLEFLRRLNEIPGVDLADEMIDRRPKVPMQPFLSDEAQIHLLAALDWLVETVRAEPGD